MTRPNRTRLTRRQLLARAGMLGAAGLSLPALLGNGAASASDRGRRAAAGRAATPRRVRSGDGGELVFDNWTAYIDPTEDGAIGTIDRFIEATGIDLTYNESINDNNEYFAVIQPILGRGDTIEADIIAPTSWMAGRLISLGWVEELPWDAIPNAENLRDDLVEPSWDPEGLYSLPYQTGITGVAYNRSATGRDLTSIEDLFDPELSGRIGILKEMRDAIGLVMLGLGGDPGAIESFDDAADAFAKLEQAKADGQIRAFTGNDYLDDLATGNFAACMGWSGDVAQLSLENPDIQFFIPEEGGISWADTMLIPKGAANIEEAAAWMNFIYDPVEAAQLTAWVQFVSPVKGVQEEVAKIDPELAGNELIFPTEETLSRLYTFANISEDVEAEFDAAFSALTGA